MRHHGGMNLNFGMKSVAPYLVIFVSTFFFFFVLKKKGKEVIKTIERSVRLQMFTILHQLFL